MTFRSPASLNVDAPRPNVCHAFGDASINNAPLLGYVLLPPKDIALSTVPPTINKLPAMIDRVPIGVEDAVYNHGKPFMLQLPATPYPEKLSTSRVSLQHQFHEKAPERLGRYGQACGAANPGSQSWLPILAAAAY